VGALVDSSPAVAEGVVYFGANNGSLYAFDAAGTIGCTGSRLQTYAL
jgi:outer membrane protein assembly factor BamB